MRRLRAIRGLVLACMMLALLSGCLSAGVEPASTPPLVAPSRPELAQPAAAIPGDRIALASVWLHERADNVGVDPAYTNDSWERDFEVQYFGVDEVFDEFARIVPAHIFRTSEVRTAVTFSVGPAGALTTYRNELRTYELHFDAGDGRLIGRVDLGRGIHEFLPPEPRQAYASPSLVGMFFRALQGESMTLIHWGDARLHAVVEAYEGERPFAGECDAWSIRYVWDPAPQEGMGSGIPPTLACLEPGSDFPLWLHEARGEGTYSLQRTSPAFGVSHVDVQPLPTLRHEKHAWRPASSTFPMPFPMLVPPGAPGGTWSRQMSDLVAGVQADPVYIQYHEESDGPYLKSALTAEAMPGLALPVVGNVSLVGALEQRAGIMASDAARYYSNFLLKRQGTTEEPDVYYAPAGGMTRANSMEPAAAELEPLVEDALMEAQLAPLLPAWSELGFILVMGIPTAQFAEWWVIEPCSPEREGWEATVSASTGSMASVRRLPAGQDCAAVASPTPPVPRLGPGHNSLMPWLP